MTGLIKTLTNMKIERYATIYESQLRQWMKEELFDWHNGYEFIGMVKDKDIYEVFYMVHEPEDNLL